MILIHLSHEYDFVWLVFGKHKGDPSVSFFKEYIDLQWVPEYPSTKCFSSNIGFQPIESIYILSMADNLVNRYETGNHRDDLEKKSNNTARAGLLVV